jgi:hypothetical protein
MMPTKTSVGPNEVVRLEVLRLAPPLLGILAPLARNMSGSDRRVAEEVAAALLSKATGTNRDHHHCVCQTVSNNWSRSTMQSLFTSISHLSLRSSLVSRLSPPVAYVGALQARLDSGRSRKRCACGGIGTSRCTWRSPGAPGVVLFSKKRTCQVRLCISRCTHVFEGAPVMSIRRTWAQKKRACKSAHRAWVSSSHQPDPQAHMW